MRDPKQPNVAKLPLPVVDNEVINAVASKADAITASLKIEKELDSEAPKNFTSTTMPFNEYEHTTLMEAVKKSGYKSAKQFMRDAFLDKALHILEGKPYGGV